MRIFAVIFFSFIFFAPVYAQFCPPMSGKVGEKKLFHITAGFGITKLYGDLGDNDALGSAGTILVDYQVKKGLFVGIESQFGRLLTEASDNFNANAKQSHNNYMAGGFRVTFHPFGFFANKKYLQSYTDVLLESLYVAAGSLYIINNYDYVYRNLNDFSTYGDIAGRDNNGDIIFSDRTRTLILPSLNVGTVLPLNNTLSNTGPVLSLVANAQVNFGGNDLLDGYTPYDGNGRLIPGNNDMYNFYSLGLRYSF